jgi:two-component system, chemotaxis family, chemotaxis protein CheY
MPTCLIVDDSHVVRKVAKRILEELGFECEEAEDGQKAYDSVLRKMPDAILLDWNMPILSGYGFLEKLRQMPDGAAPRVVICTVMNDLVHIKKALAAGADEYIMKPFDAEIIRSRFQLVGLL